MKIKTPRKSIFCDGVRDASIDLGAGGIDKARVCDRTLDAILLLLDGDGWTAFEKAGIKGYSLDEKDQMIGITQARLKSLDSKKN